MTQINGQKLYNEIKSRCKNCGCSGGVLCKSCSTAEILDDVNDAIVEQWNKTILFFEIPLPPRTKKNSQRILRNRKTGKYFVAPSEIFEQYEKEAAYFIKGRYSGNYPVNVKCLFYMPTKRRVDLVNLLEAIDDILTHCKVIIDDDDSHIAGHDESRVLYDKENPRTEIYISQLEEIN